MALFEKPKEGWGQKNQPKEEVLGRISLSEGPARRLPLNFSSYPYSYIFELLSMKIPASPSVTFGVSFFAVFLGYSLGTKEEEFYCLQGRSEGLFRKMTLVFPCFAVYATYEQVSLSHGYRGGSQGTPWCSRNTLMKNDTLKMTLGRARKMTYTYTFWSFRLTLFKHVRFISRV